MARGPIGRIWAQRCENEYGEESEESQTVQFWPIVSLAGDLTTGPGSQSVCVFFIVAKR